MRELPILFNTAMVSAILDGRKVETRRPLKPTSAPCSAAYPAQAATGLWMWYVGGVEDRRIGLLPFGAVGDRLWVRETYCPRSNGAMMLERIQTPFYRAADGVGDMKKPSAWNWRPSIHMPKWAARIWLEVVEVRVERVRDIDEGGAQLEGIDADLRKTSNRAAFAELWNSIYLDSCPWDANGFVWVARFKVLSTDGKPGGGT